MVILDAHGWSRLMRSVRSDAISQLPPYKETNLVIQAHPQRDVTRQYADILKHSAVVFDAENLAEGWLETQ